MNLVLRDLYYNKLCASCLVPDRVRRLLYSWGGGIAWSWFQGLPALFFGKWKY